MAETIARRSPPERAEYENRAIVAGEAADVERHLSLPRRLANQGWLRKTLVVVVLVALWQGYAGYAANPLMFPSFGETIVALWQALAHGPLLLRVAISLKILLGGYAIGVALAALITGFAVSFRIGQDILSTLTAMFNPLPAIALLPLALLWFGLGAGSLVFVIVHSVLWAVALNTYSGFLAVPESQRMAGQNVGLRGPRFVAQILMPAAFPSILAGLKIGWAFAWRTEIAAELVFGATSGNGGLGWFIFEARNQLDTAAVFAGLTAVIVIGLVMENVVFRGIEARTVRRWGMQR